MLRIYEFDRYNGTVFQVDMMIGNESVLVHQKSQTLPTVICGVIGGHV